MEEVAHLCKKTNDALESLTLRVTELDAKVSAADTKLVLDDIMSVCVSNNTQLDSLCNFKKLPPAASTMHDLDLLVVALGIVSYNYD